MNDKTIYIVYTLDNDTKLVLARGPTWWIFPEIQEALPRYQKFAIEIDDNQDNRADSYLP